VGHGIDNMDDRFSDRVAASLERKYPGRFVVANLGDPGLEISMIEARVEGVLKKDYDVDMFIYVVCLNDIEGYDPKMQQSNQNLQQLAPKSRLIAGTYFLNWLYFRFVQFNRPEVRDYYPNLHDSYHSPAWDGFRQHLDEMKKHCAAKGAELRVVIFPFLSNLGPEYPFRDVHAKIADYCRASEIRVLDLEPVLSQKGDVDLTVSRYDAHPNERAHEIAADAIFEKLLDDADQFCTESSPPDKKR
jgi:hypothetical protein